MALKITNEADRPTLYVYGDIGAAFGGITANDLRLALADIPKKTPIDVRINSDGGVFEDGIAMRTLLKAREGEVRVFVDGIAASAASLVAMGGDVIEMAKGSWMMIHEARMDIDARIGGTANRLRELSDQLQQLASHVEATNGQIVSIYEPRWKGQGSIADALAAETWFTESETVAAGLADRVAESEVRMAAHVNADKAAKLNFTSVPEPLRELSPDYSKYEAGLQLLKESQSQEA